MSPTALALLLLLLGLLLGTALGYSLAVARSASARAGGRDEAASLRAQAAQWQARAEELAERTQVAEERAERDGSVLRALAPVRQQLELVSTRVTEMEKQRAAQHATLTEQLRVGAEADQELRRATSSLEGALRSRSTRGMWGEVELARVLELSGMMRHLDFTEQRSVASVIGRRNGSGSTTRARDGARPDVVVNLPGGGFLAVDAKVPLDAYLRASTLSDDEPEDAQAAEREHATLLTAHARALRTHVNALADRHYDRSLGSSPELVVLFVPAEPILSSALESDPTLMEHALGRGVALASPPSLLALLRTCATAWARTAVNDDARELLDLGRTLYERLGTVAGHLENLGGALRRSVTAYNQAVGSMESRLLVTARSFETLADALPTPHPLSPDEAQVRHVTATDLIEPPRQHPDFTRKTQSPPMGEHT